MDPNLAALLNGSASGNNAQQAPAAERNQQDNAPAAGQAGQPDVLGEMMRQQGMPDSGGMPGADAGSAGPGQAPGSGPSRQDVMRALMAGGGIMGPMGILGHGGPVGIMGIDPRLMAMQQGMYPMMGMPGMAGMGSRAYERAMERQREAYEDAMEGYQDAMEQYQDAMEDAMDAAMYGGRRRR